jgi:hypothetical protein
MSMPAAINAAAAPPKARASVSVATEEDIGTEATSNGVSA